MALAWRSLWRQRHRSVISMAAVGLVVFMAILLFSFAGAVMNNLYQEITQQVGQIQIHAARYRNARDFNAGLLHGARRLRATVRQAAPTAVVVGVLRVPVLLAGPQRSRGVALSGRDWPPALRRDIVAHDLSDGTFLDGGAADGIVLGRSLANALQVGVGDELQAYTPAAGEVAAASYRVIGLLHFNDVNREVGTALVSLAAAQRLAAPDALGSLELHYPEIRTLAGDAAVTADARRLRIALGSGFQVETWRQLDPGISNMVNLLLPLTVLMSGIFFVLAGLLVLNTVYLGTLERVREFGMMLGLGARTRTVVAMVMVESVLLCLSGAAVGATVGLAAVAVLSRGFSLPGMTTALAQLGVEPVFYPTIEPWQVLVAIVFAVATAILAALGPAVMAARIEPVEAMRYTL